MTDDTRIALEPGPMDALHAQSPDGALPLADEGAEHEAVRVPVDPVAAQPDAPADVPLIVSGKTARRLQELNGAIDANPDDASNYLLRGELFATLGEYPSARVDLERAYELARRELEASRWGFTAQVIQDRALVALRELRAADRA
jgi:tetratricopeptide (TPR) repeat protein